MIIPIKVRGFINQGSELPFPGNESVANERVRQASTLRR